MTPRNIPDILHDDTRANAMVTLPIKKFLYDLCRASLGQWLNFEGCKWVVTSDSGDIQPW